MRKPSHVARRCAEGEAVQVAVAADPIQVQLI